MCPACMTTLAMVTAGATSTGGIATLVVSKLRGKKETQRQEPQERGETDGQEQRER
jgi:hypothetical protein